MYYVNEAFPFKKFKKNFQTKNKGQVTTGILNLKYQEKGVL